MSETVATLTRWDDLVLEPVTAQLRRKIVTGERAMLGHIWLDQGCVVPLHSHEAEQLSYIFQGALEFSIEGKKYVVRAGEVLWIPSWVKHQAVALEDTFEMDIFSPIRHDWLDKSDSYFRQAPVPQSEIPTGQSPVKLFRWADTPREALNERLDRSFLSGDRITVAHMDLKQGCVVPMHHHESEQLTWVRSGELRLIVGGVPHTVSAGSVLTIPSQVPHSAEALTDVRALDIFSPTRLDWINGTDSYLRPRAEKV